MSNCGDSGSDQQISKPGDYRYDGPACGSGIIGHNGGGITIRSNTLTTQMIDTYIPGIKQMLQSCGIIEPYSDAIAREMLQKAVRDYNAMSFSDYIDWSVQYQITKLKEGIAKREEGVKNP